MKRALSLFSVALVLALIASAGGLTPAFANLPMIVNTTADNTAIDGHCSLREAITNVNTGSQLHANPGECMSGSSTYSIDFAPGMAGKTIKLSSDLPPLSHDMSIAGLNSAKTVTISGNGLHRIFTIETTSLNVTLTHLNLINGFAATSSGGEGGAIFNNATLTIIDSTFSGNKASSGGAILDRGDGSGENSSLNIQNSTFYGNTATTDGGAIYIASVSGGTATTTILNSTFTANRATTDGGAIMQYTDTISTTLGLFSDTISGNGAGLSGGDLYLNNGTVGAINTIIANSTGGGVCTFLGGTVIGSNGYNVATGGCLSGGVANKTGNPKLGPLGKHGGFTQTMVPASNSPAVDAGLNLYCLAYPISNLDQRGHTRPYNGTCDIGSVEYSPVQYLLNGGFETYTSQFSIPSDWTAIGFHLNPDGIDTTHFEEGTASVAIKGAPGKTKTLSQTRPVKSPAAGWFTLSYWVAGSSVPGTGTCQVQAALYSGSTLKMTKFIACPTGTYAFKHKTIGFWTTTTISKAVVTITYSKPSGQAWFDAVSFIQ